MPAAPALTRAEIRLHGHRVSYRTGGREDGPLLLLVHGITNSSATWEPVLALLAQDFNVIAPDLLGHGDSDKPRGDYSVGAAASLLRDLMLALDHEHATVVGHSLGGGIAMQLAYQFPERVGRLVLVSSGGLGREVTIALRAATLPGSELVLPLLVSRPLLGAGGVVAGLLGRVGLSFGPDIAEIAAGIASLQDNEARRAFVQMARSVIDVGGQLTDATDRLYLAEALPTLLVWGERDPIIPPYARSERPSADARQPAGDLRAQRPFPTPRRRDPLRAAHAGVRRADRAGKARWRVAAREAPPARAAGRIELGPHVPRGPALSAR